MPDAPSSARPTLRYIEYHLVEHCNLTCNRCGHFSPLAPASEADPHDFERDLRQLAHHFEKILKIRLLGGEPLLHPTAEAFVDIARAVFPQSDVRIVTNGTRLKAMHDRFWEVCRRAGVTIDLSLYPIMAKALPAIEELCRRQGVALNVSRCDTFYAGLNPHGDSDPQRSMKYCRTHFYAPFLKDSRLYVCAFPPTTQYFNNKFGKSLVDDPGIDIFDPTLNGRDILRRLNTPVETCRFCACLWEAKPWELIRVHRAEDYSATTIVTGKEAPAS